MVVIYGSPKKVGWTLHIPHTRLLDIAKNPERFYKPFPKKRLGREPRQIDNPTGELKVIQKRLNQAILRVVPLPSFMIGGVWKRDPLDHARCHVGQRVVVTIDVRDCFPSITHRQVFSVFRGRVGCSPTVAKLLTRLTTYQGHLPLGASTSTTLANLVLAPILEEVVALVRRNELQVTQFIDDTALSGADLDATVLTEIAVVLSRNGLRLGREKIKVMRSGWAQMVTGKTVNRQLSIPLKRRKAVRAALHTLAKVERHDAAYEGLYRSLEGRIQEVRRLHSEEGQRLWDQLRELPGLSGNRTRNPPTKPTCSTKWTTTNS